MVRDSEGYTCVKRLHDGLFRWVIIDRYDKAVNGEAPHDEYGTARQRADDMNDDLIARRLADTIAKR